MTGKKKKIEYLRRNSQGVDFFKRSKNLLAGYDCIVIAGGPDAINIIKTLETTDLEKTIIVCVKQALLIESLENIADIHFYNEYNLRRYRKNNSIFKIFSNSKAQLPNFNSYDLKLTVETPSNFDDSLAGSLLFDEYLFDSGNELRPWGPGIMYESVFYLLIFLGIKTIQTIGWEVADSRGYNIHFNDSFWERISRQSAGVRRLTRKLSYLFPRLFHVCGLVYHKADTTKKEVQLVSDSLPKFRKWILEQGVKLDIRGKSHWHK